MKQLPTTHPYIHKAFISGRFGVKRSARHWSSVGADMCREQTINRTQKGPGGVIGSTKRKMSVAKWEIVYHERLAISNSFREVTGMSHSRYELNNPEQLSSYSNLAKNEQTICTFMAYICDKENPFHVTDTTDS